MGEVHVEHAVAVGQVPLQHEFHLHRLEELVQRDSGVDGDQHELLQIAPALVPVEEQHHGDAGTEWEPTYSLCLAWNCCSRAARLLAGNSLFYIPRLLLYLQEGLSKILEE